jgi:hypothetical protein
VLHALSVRSLLKPFSMSIVDAKRLSVSLFEVFVVTILFSALSPAQRGMTSKIAADAERRAHWAKPSNIGYDFFPLRVGSSWKYSYVSDEEIYESLFLQDRELDSGTVSFSVSAMIPADTSYEWTIQETDEILHQTINVNGKLRDTTYYFEHKSSFTIHERIDSLHTLISSSYLPIWQFPQKWTYYYNVTGGPVQRYSSDSAVLYSVDTFRDFPIDVADMDTMTFKEAIGLVDEVYHIIKGPNTPYYLDWHACLLDFLADVKMDNNANPICANLYQNYPNPFNPTTTIRYALAQRTLVSLTVFSTLGQQVATLVDDTEDAGYHEVRFDGTGLASGVYFYRLIAGDYVAVKRLVLVR